MSTPDSPEERRRAGDGAAPIVVFMTGRDLDTAGDDAACAEALADFVRVLWVDPVCARTDSQSGPDSTTQSISPTLTRLRTTMRRWPTPTLSRAMGRRALDRSISSALADLGADNVDPPNVAVVLSDPLGRFPDGVDGHRLFYVTGDWVSGAQRARLPRRAVRSSIEANSARADTIAAVSHTLALRLHLYSKSMDAVRVVPAGCTVPSVPVAAPYDLPHSSPVALVGDLDEQWDYDMLDAVAHSGQSVVVIGSKKATTAAIAARVDSFLSHPSVRWLGALPDSSTSHCLSTASVGIAPFAVDAVNRARFPTHTLRYLASGLPVVTTDLPATRWLDSEHVTVARSSVDFALRVADCVAVENNSTTRAARREVASAHSWSVRATTMLRLTALHRHVTEVPRSFAPLRQHPPA